MRVILKLQISAKCGDEALLHLYDVHNIWTIAYSAKCVLTPPDLLNSTMENVTTARAISTTVGGDKQPTTSAIVAVKTTTTPAKESSDKNSESGGNDGNKKFGGQLARYEINSKKRRNLNERILKKTKILNKRTNGSFSSFNLLFARCKKLNNL